MVFPDMDDRQRRLIVKPEQQGQHDEHAEPETWDSQKEMDITRAPVSTMLLGRSALTIPTGSPTSHEISTARMPISALKVRGAGSNPPRYPRGRTTTPACRSPGLSSSGSIAGTADH